MLEISDDSGFLAVVVPESYESFVHRNWSLDRLFERFRQQMARRSLLIWGTGLEGLWRVDVRLRESSTRGFRAISGPLRVAGESILVTSFESLTMAAQFDDVRLPERHEKDQLVELSNGDYRCRIVQMFDPERQGCAEDGGADFVAEITPEKIPSAPWSEVPWYSDGGS